MTVIYSENGKELDPVEIYEFTYGEGRKIVIRYTSSSVPVVFSVAEQAGFAVMLSEAGSPITFPPETLKHGEVEMSGEINRSVIQINTTKNNTVADLFLSGTPSFPINVKIWRLDSNSSISVSGRLAIFQGRVTGCAFSGFEATLNCEPIYTQIKKAGLRRVYEASCSHSLYDPATCKLSKDSGAALFTATVTPAVIGRNPVQEIVIDGVVIIPGVTGVTGSPETVTMSAAGSVNIKVPLTVPGQASFTAFGHINIPLANVTSQPVNIKDATTGLTNQSAFYTGGFVKLIKTTGGGTLHLIAEQNNTLLTLTRPIPTYDQVGVISIEIYPGCDHSARTCCDKFKNIDHFGGFPYMMAANPFVGSHVPTGTR